MSLYEACRHDTHAVAEWSTDQDKHSCNLRGAVNIPPIRGGEVDGVVGKPSRSWIRILPRSPTPRNRGFRLVEVSPLLAESVKT